MGVDVSQRRAWSSLVLVGLGALVLVDVGLGALAHPGVISGRSSPSVADLVAWWARLGVGLSGVWLATVAAVGALDLARAGRVPPPWRGGVLRPAVVGLLIGAVVCSAHPASADSPRSSRVRTTPLPVPDRPLSPPTQGHRPVSTPSPHASTWQVRPGACLWSITSQLLGPRAPAQAVDRGWRLLYAANRDRIGPDPDLVRPGAVLTVPSSLSTRSPTPAPDRSPRP